MNKQSAPAQVERIVRSIFESFAAGGEDEAEDLTPYFAPILKLFADEDKTLTLQDAIYRAERWSGILQDVGHHLRELRDAEPSRTS